MREYKGKNIAIIGGYNYSFYESGIPEDFKVWSLNGLCKKLKRIDLLFDLHPWNNTSDDYPVPDYYEWLQKNKYDYYVIKPSYDNKIKNIILYPLKEIMSAYGNNMKNSLPMMILYAWHIGGVKNIYLYGLSDDEFTKYPEMGASLFQAIGFVRAKEINVYFVTDCDYNKSNDIYGFYRLTKDRVKE